MSLFANADVNRLQAHNGLRQLSDSMAVTFSALFLLRQGLSPATVFLTYAAILMLRFALRPLVVRAAASLGLRRTLILGTALTALQFLSIANVTGVNAGLYIYMGVTALSDVFYWTTFHALFASAGAVEDRGRQLGAREIITQAVRIVGPATGGFALSAWGPWVAFGLAAGLSALSIWPLARVADVRVQREAPLDMWSYVRSSVTLFATDGWIVMGSQTAWAMLLFRALGERFDAYGAVMALAAVSGALAAYMFGHSIDRGRGRRAVLAGAACLTGLVLMQALLATSTVGATIAVIAGAAIGRLYLPALMTALYNSAKGAPCTLRFTFYTEGGWDMGAASACLACAAVGAAGLPLQIAVLLALPAIVLQVRLLLPGFAPGGARA